MRKYFILIGLILTGFFSFIISTEAASQPPRQNDVTITNFDFKVNGNPIDESFVIYLWGVLDWGFELTINNSNKQMKNGDTFVKEISIGPWLHDEWMSFPSKNVDIIGEDGMTYGTMNIPSYAKVGQYTKVPITFKLNNNITKVTEVKSKFVMSRYAQYFNNKYDNELYPFNVSIDGLQMKYRGRSPFLAEINPQLKSALSVEPKLNQFFVNIYSHGDYARSIGRPDEDLPEYRDGKYSYWMDGDYSSVGSILLQTRILRPLATNDNDYRISDKAIVSPDVTNYLTQLTQNSGETWTDFKNRVYSKKYQVGRYTSSNGIGLAVNMGDYTSNGWKDGTVKIWDIFKHSNIQQTSNQLLGVESTELTRAFIRIFGPQGKIKGGMSYHNLILNVYFNNYFDEQKRNFTYESSYIPKGSSTPITNRLNQIGTVRSTQYAINVSEGQVAVQVSDKDTGALFPNVKVNLESNDTESSLKLQSNTNDGGMTSFVNLYPRKYKLSIDNVPNGYQSKVEFSNGDSNTSISNSGEFTLANKGSAFVKISLEKIKHQAVRFTVKDTAKKPIAGEVFSIMRNGQSVGTYPTDNHGVFSLARLNAGEYSLTPTNPLRTGARAFVVEKGKTNTLEVEAVLPVIPEITANGPNSINLGNVNIGQVTRSTIPLDVTYRGDNGYIVTARQSSNTNIDFELNDTLITTQEKEFTNLNGTANPITTMINYQLNAKTNSNSTKGNESTNIIFSFKYKL